MLVAQVRGMAKKRQTHTTDIPSPRAPTLNSSGTSDGSVMINTGREDTLRASIAVIGRVGGDAEGPQRRESRTTKSYGEDYAHASGCGNGQRES